MRYLSRRTAAIAFCLAAGAPASAAAQIELGVRLGMIGSSDLVRDSIVQAISVRPQTGPTGALRVGIAVHERLRVVGDVGLSRSNLDSRTDTAKTVITALSVWTPSVGLGMRLTPWLAAEATVGAVIYAPSVRTGTLFSEGAPVEPALGVALMVERGLGGRFVGAVHARYDVHRFSTAALEARGFDGKTVVHRVGISVAISREFGRAAGTD